MSDNNANERAYRTMPNVACSVCLEPTINEGTRLCNACWELKRGLRRASELMRPGHDISVKRNILKLLAETVIDGVSS